MSTILIIFIVGVLLGLIKFESLDTINQKWQLKFLEFWNDSFNFIITGLVAYYFYLYRLPLLVEGRDLTLSDFGLFTIFVLGIFGHLCVMSKNITDGIQVIIKRILDR